MNLTPQEQASVESTLVTTSAEMLSSAMAVKAQMIRPQRIQPLAVVLSRNVEDSDTLTFGLISILDVAQRIATLKYGLQQAHGFAFLFLYDGFITEAPDAPKRDALLMVSGTAWGVWRASASPYQYSGVGAAFSPTLDVPEACDPYREVFSGTAYTLPEA